VPEQSAASAKPRTLVLGSQGMGRGDDGLGLTILHNFLKSLVTNPLRPDKIVCWNAGVTLLTGDSPVIAALQDLEGIGVEILACKTCVEHFGLQDKLRAGEVSTMPTISDLLLRSDVLTV
jgi:intracellular sulfur oxidation DsrE/DsrF family protein